MGEAGLQLYFPVALVVAFFVTAALGMVLERLLIRRLYGRPLDTLLATWGVSLVLQQAARSIFGAPNVQVISPPWLSGGLEVTDTLILPYARLFIIGLAAALPRGRVLLPLPHRPRQAASARSCRTARWRAPSASPPHPSTCSTFALASGLAGVAGCALSLLGPIGPSLGTFYIVDAFLVVVLGGVGQLIGTIAAARRHRRARPRPSSTRRPPRWRR